MGKGGSKGQVLPSQAKGVAKDTCYPARQRGQQRTGATWSHGIGRVLDGCMTTLGLDRCMTTLGLVVWDMTTLGLVVWVYDHVGPGRVGRNRTLTFV